MPEGGVLCRLVKYRDRHSSIKFVTPHQSHIVTAKAICEQQA